MMNNSEPRLGRILISFIIICVVALPIVVYSAFSYGDDTGDSAGIIKENRDDWRPLDTFDYNSGANFKNHYELSTDYLGGAATVRTLEEYYSRRQYHGSPPFIPHEVESDSEGMDCLDCHGDGDFASDIDRYAPKIPHPELISCRQCHVTLATNDLFVENDWKSLPPPRLGQSHLPGSPPPIPHQLQMRGNCIACHIGPGAVATIRVDHPTRGYCRQCHVPITNIGLFERKSGNN